MKAIILVPLIVLSTVFHCVNPLKCYDGHIIFVNGKEQEGTKKPELSECPKYTKHCLTGFIKDGKYKKTKLHECDTKRLCTKDGCTDGTMTIQHGRTREVLAADLCCCSKDKCNSSQKMQYEYGIMISLITTVISYSLS
ncbi:hypothetical protein AB6A40_002895 [Gnathostoma spinigerum]|uniref:Uncharacterized protein n=1 Tax=Gnathostoma spinigerum TaxID=75299 RepID=A0ABD6EAF8_9BILA